MERKRLGRSNDKRLIAGVCGGIGEYLGLNPNLVRLVFMVLFLIQPLSILFYLLLAFLLPASDSATPAEGEAAPAPNRPDAESNRWLGAGLVAIGAILLLRNLGLLAFSSSWLGAVLLIGLGVYLLLHNEG